MNTNRLSRWFDAIEGIEGQLMDGILAGLIVVALGLGTSLHFGEEKAAAGFLGTSGVLSTWVFMYILVREHTFRRDCREVGIQNPVTPKRFWMTVAALPTIAITSFALLILGLYMVSKMRLPW